MGNEGETVQDVPEDDGAASSARVNRGRHLLGIGLGVGFLLLLVVVAQVHQAVLNIRHEQLVGMRSADGVGWVLAGAASLQVAVGLLLAGAVLSARRLPWLPVVPGMVLLYLAIEGPLTYVHRGSLPDVWSAAITGSFAQQYRAAAGVMAGASLAAAVWGWVGKRRDARDT